MRQQSRAAKLLAVIAAVGCGMIALGEGCEDLLLPCGLSSSPDGKYHVLYLVRDKPEEFRFFLLPGETAFVEPEHALYSDQLGVFPAGSFLLLGMGLERTAPVAFDPESKHLAFANETSGDYEIYEVDLTTMQRRVMCPHPAKDASPSYSPDGKYLAFVSSRSGRSEIWLWDRAAQTLSQLTHENKDIELARFLSDRKIVYYHSWDEDTGGIFDLQADRSETWPSDWMELAIDSRHGLMVEGREQKDPERIRVFLTEIATGSRHELGFLGELANFSPAISPDGKWVLAASSDAVQVLPASGGPARSFALPRALASGIFLTWMPDGKSFRLMASSVQLTAEIDDPGQKLIPRDKPAAGVLALAALAQSRDTEFKPLAERLDSLPDPVRIDTGAGEEVDLTRLMAAYDAGQYQAAAEVWKDHDNAELKELAAEIQLAGTDFGDYRTRRAEVGAALSDRTRFVDGLDDRQLRVFIKHQKPLIRERLLARACTLSNQCRRKLSPPARKIGWYLKLHSGSQLSGYLATTLAEVSLAYGHTGDAAKYYEIAAKTAEDRQESLTQLAEIYCCKKKDPAAELKINEALMAEFPESDAGEKAWEGAGRYWLEHGDAERGYELLARLALDADENGSWHELQKKSEPEFRELIFAHYAAGPCLAAEHLVRAIELSPAEQPDPLLLDLAEDTLRGMESDESCGPAERLKAGRETLFIYSIAHDPEAMTSLRIYEFFSALRLAEPGAEIEARWAKAAADHPALAKTPAYLILQGMLAYDRRDYAAARARFEEALGAMGGKEDKIEAKKSTVRGFILICLAQENNPQLRSRLGEAIGPNPRQSRDVEEVTLSASLKKLPLEQISGFYLASQAHARATYYSLEVKEDQSNPDRLGRDFVSRYPQSPLAAAMLFDVRDHEGVLERYPDSFAAYRVLWDRAEKSDEDLDYWLAARTRGRLLNHPELNREDKAELLIALGEYELDHAHDERKALEYVRRAEEAKPSDEARKKLDELKAKLKPAL